MERYPVDLPDVLDRSYEKDIINQKYDFIDEIIQEVLVNKEKKAALTDKADRLLTHNVLGLPIFAGHHGPGVLPHLHHRRLAEGLLRNRPGDPLRRGPLRPGGHPRGAAPHLPCWWTVSSPG